MKRIFLPRGMTKKAVKDFFKKVDGSIVGKTSKSNQCPLHTFIVKELGFDPNIVDVQLYKICIYDKTYETDDGWVSAFVHKIDEYGEKRNREEATMDQFGYRNYDHSRSVTGDECLMILKEIEKNEV